MKITFVYKTGIHSNLNAKDFKPKRKNAAAVHTDAELCSYASVEDNKLCLHSSSDTYRNNSGTTSDRYVRILDLREGNEESSEETTGCKASVYAEFDDCTRVGKFVKLFDFRHFERFFRFDQSDRKTYKKAISDGVNVSVVLDCGFGNTLKEK